MNINIELSLFVGLSFLFTPVVGRSQSVEVSTFQSRPVEYISAVSPDLKYAILKTAAWDDRGARSDYHASVLGWRLVEVLDIKEGSYRTLSELPADLESAVFSGSVAAILCRDNYPDNIQARVELTLYNFLQSDSVQTIFEKEAGDTSNSWLNEFCCCEYAYRDSVIAYARIRADTDTLGLGYGTDVIIRRLQADGEAPAIGVIPDARDPHFTHDGTQLLATAMKLPDPEFKVVVYNIAQDSVVEYSLPRAGFKAQRQTADSPIYYLDLGAPDIRCLEPLTGADMALTYTLGRVTWFSLTVDSIVYEVIASKEGKTGTQIKTKTLK